MGTRLRSWLMLLAALVLPLASTPTYAAPGPLKAGAARVEISPPIADLPAPFKTIGDKVFVRALVLDDGATRVVIVIADAPTIQAKVAADLAARIAQQARVPVENVVLGTTHTHGMIRIDTNPVGISLPGSAKVTDQVIAATLEAVKQAAANLKPARAGYATGKAAMVVNRNQWLTEQHRYIDGIDRTGREPIDQTLGVFKVETLTGEPIAFMLNYSIEPVVMMAAPSEVSGDVPGATSRYIEDHFGGKAVALFTIGAAGSPLYRVYPDRPGAKSDPHVIMNAMGAILGEEALSAAYGMEGMQTNLVLRAAMKSLQCPGKATKPFNLPNQCAYTRDSTLPACVFKDEDAPPVTLKMGLLKIGDLALVQADANVTPALWEKLRAASPIKNTQVVALTFGPLRFVVDDAAYPLNTYEATATSAKMGCAQDGFISTALGMMDAAR